MAAAGAQGKGCGGRDLLFCDYPTTKKAKSKKPKKSQSGNFQKKYFVQETEIDGEMQEEDEDLRLRFLCERARPNLLAFFFPRSCRTSPLCFLPLLQ